MTERPRMEKFFERAASFGSGTGLHPAALFQQVHDAAAASVRDGSIANGYEIGLAAADLKALTPAVDRLREGLLEMLEELRVSKRLAQPGPWDVGFEARAGMPAGQMMVRASFRNPPGSGSAPLAGRTVALQRHRGKVLVVAGFGRRALTHTPFVIGRSPQCDLVIPDLAVSRRHALVESTADGSLWIRDLGSRNRLSVGGETVDEWPLLPGVTIRLGSTDLTLEVED